MARRTGSHRGGLLSKCTLRVGLQAWEPGKGRGDMVAAGRGELEGEALRECSPFHEFPCLSSDMGRPVRGWVGGSGARRQHVLSIYFSHLSRQFCILRVQRPLLRPLALLPPNEEGEDQHLTPSMRCPLNPRDIRFHRTPPAGPCPGPTPPLSQLASACSP